jgi:hypothetical protein
VSFATVKKLIRAAGTPMAFKHIYDKRGPNRRYLFLKPMLIIRNSSQRKKSSAIIGYMDRKRENVFIANDRRPGGIRMSKEYVIDGNSLLFRAYYATAYVPHAKLEDERRVPTNALFALAHIYKISPHLKAGEHIIVGFDVGKKNISQWRI